MDYRAQQQPGEQVAMPSYNQLLFGDMQTVAAELMDTDAATNAELTVALINMARTIARLEKQLDQLTQEKPQ